MELSKIMVELEKEIGEAVEKWGEFGNYHEGYAVMLEELDELWDEIKGEQRPSFLREEALHVAAAAIKFIHGLL